MRRVRSVAAVAVVTAVVTALVVVSTVGSLGSVIAFAGGGLVVLGAAAGGRLWLAAVPVAIAAGLAVLLVAAPSPDLADWTPAIVTVLVFLGVGGALCVALGALIRRLGRPIPTGERSD